MSTTVRRDIVPASSVIGELARAQAKVLLLVERGEIPPQFALEANQSLLKIAREGWQDQFAGPKPITVDLVVRKTSDVMDVDIRKELSGGRLSRKVSLAWKIAAHLARKLTSMSYHDIARELGRDHSQVVVAYRWISARTAIEESLRRIVRSIERAVHDAAGAVPAPWLHATPALSAPPEHEVITFPAVPTKDITSP